MTIVLKKSYGGVCLLSTFLVGEYWMFSEMENFMRRDTFTPNFMMQFLPQHQREIGDDPAQNGHPDDCNGRYIRYASYKDWYFLNVVKRWKQNNLENIVHFAPLSLINGLFLPYPTMGLLTTYIAGRALYNQGYLEKENVRNWMRMTGAVMCHAATGMTLMVSLIIGLRLSRGHLP